GLVFPKEEPMRNRTVSWLLAVVGLGCATLSPNLACAGPLTMLHSFAGKGNDGDYPTSGLTLSGTTLFGMTWSPWSDDEGTIFSINTDGTGFKVLHKFTSENDDGHFPTGGLTLFGTTLFGTARSGVVFSINTDGTGFKVMHKLKGWGNPNGRLTLSGTTLFGTTAGNERGTIFSIDTDGTGFKVLHEFSGGNPNGGLTLSGTTLFGTTWAGGKRGTIFSINTDGTGFKLLHEFSGGVNGPGLPNGSLILSGTTLFGTTRVGVGKEPAPGEILFSINTDGTGFKEAYRFSDGAAA